MFSWIQRWGVAINCPVWCLQLTKTYYFKKGWYTKHHNKCLHQGTGWWLWKEECRPADFLEKPSFKRNQRCMYVCMTSCLHLCHGRTTQTDLISALGIGHKCPYQVCIVWLNILNQVWNDLRLILVILSLGFMSVLNRLDVWYWYICTCNCWPLQWIISVS